MKKERKVFKVGIIAILLATVGCNGLGTQLKDLFDETTVSTI